MSAPKLAVSHILFRGRPAADRHSGCRREQACQLASRHRHFADPLPTRGLPPAGRKANTMTAKRTAFLLRSVRRRRTACSAGKHDHFRRHAPAMVILPIQTNTLFKAIETSWSWSPYLFTPYSIPPVGGKGIRGPRCSHYVQLGV